MKRLNLVVFFVCVSAAFSAFGASLADFPRLGGETSDSPRIARAVASVPLGVLDVPAGRYEMDSTVKIENGASLRLDKSARFVAVKKLGNMFFYNATAGWKNRDNALFITGGEFDGAGLAECCVQVVAFQHFTFRDSVFRNPKAAALIVGDKDGRGGYELIANNLYFRNTMRGLAGNIGMLIYSGDNHFTDCVIVDYTIGIDLRRGGSNRFTRCHVWGGPIPPPKKGEPAEMLKDSICFKLSGGESILRDCYADTGMIGFKVAANTRLLGCSYYNNYKTFKMDNPLVIEHLRGILTVADGYFSKTSPRSRLYREGTEADKDGKLFKLVWRDNIINKFAPEDLGLPESVLR